MLHTPICDLLGIQLPILQAGMGIYKGVVTTPELVAAVSNAGGLGCLGATGLEPDELLQAIRKIRMLTDKPFGVDLIIPQKLSMREGTREERPHELEDGPELDTGLAPVGGGAAHHASQVLPDSDRHTMVTPLPEAEENAASAAAPLMTAPEGP